MDQAYCSSRADRFFFFDFPNRVSELTTAYRTPPSTSDTLPGHAQPILKADTQVFPWKFQASAENQWSEI